MAVLAVLSFMGYWSILQSMLGILFWCKGLIIVGLNSFTFQSVSHVFVQGKG
jgi:hypothetical protein